MKITDPPWLAHRRWGSSCCFTFKKAAAALFLFFRPPGRLGYYYLSDTSAAHVHGRLGQGEEAKVAEGFRL